MAESELVQLIAINASSILIIYYSIYVFSILSIGHILISDLVVIDLFMHSLTGMYVCMILRTLLGCTFFTTKEFLHEICIILAWLMASNTHNKASIYIYHYN